MRQTNSDRVIVGAAAIAMALLYSSLGTTFSGAQEIRTPAAPDTPRVNGPSVFGVRPGSPFLYKIPATGSGTLQYSVDGLPAGLQVNSATGQITGTLTTPGEHLVTLRATNALGSNEKKFRIKVGDTIGLTPAMGWNSWNCWGTTVTRAKVQQAAAAMVSSGLSKHGWNYVNIDVAWQGQRGGAYNAIQPNSNFPDMQGLCDSIHNQGLKVGIYSSPFIQTYCGYVGGSANNPEGTFVKGDGQETIGTYSFAQNDAKQFAAWGIDYLKYDWAPNRLPETCQMEAALLASGRDIVYSLSTGVAFSDAQQITSHANSWRKNEAADIVDTWSSMSANGFGKDRWAPYSRPGHLNDPDMLVVGRIGWGAVQHPTNLTPDEQYTHITLWSMLSAPLLLGCDLTQLDAFTLNLLTNDEVLAVDQDSLCKQATCASTAGNAVVYVKDLEDGSKAVGLFNTGATALTVTASWSDLGLSNPQMVRDLWRQRDLGSFNDRFEFSVAPHGAELFRMSTAVPEPSSIGLSFAPMLAWLWHSRGKWK